MADNFKLLITEDSRDTIRAVKKVLSDKGYRVECCAKNGKAVIEAVKMFLPDVVIMDMYMPHFDAPTVCKTIRSESISKKPAVIITANYENSFMEKEATEAGAACILIKPFDYDVLCERINKLCVAKLDISRPDERKELADIDLEVVVTDILHQIGIPAHIKGYQYVRTAIILCFEDTEIINHVTKELYPAVAKMHNTTATRVERSIRHAIETAWDRGDVDVLNAYFGYTIHNQKGKPTNSEFIAMISDKLRLKIKAM